MSALRTPSLCLIFLSGLLLGGCGSDDPVDEPTSLTKVKKFGGGYPIYYSGDEVAGHPLEEVFGEEGGGVFIYGGLRARAHG